MENVFDHHRSRRLRWSSALALVTASLLNASLFAANLSSTSRTIRVNHDTPYGHLPPGSDITKALQWSVDQTGWNKTRTDVLIDSGRYGLSDTVTIPHSFGAQLHGAGFIDTRILNPHETGPGTVLEWHGEAGGTMLEYAASHGDIGHFSLRGQPAKKPDAPKAAIGLLFTKLKPGIGTGTCIIRPVQIDHCKYGVQVGLTKGEGNSDQLVFEYLIARGCESVYHGVNTQGVDIIFQRLVADKVRYGVLMDGGGSMWIQSAFVPAKNCTLIKINNHYRAGVGKFNGNFRVSHLKVDPRGDEGFTLIDCEEETQVSFFVDFGQISDENRELKPAIKLAGRNNAVVMGLTADLQVEGRKVGGYAPSCMVRDCRLWNGDRPVFLGEINGRLRDCVDRNGQWVADADFPRDAAEN